MSLSTRAEAMAASLAGSFAIQSSRGVVAKVWWPAPTLMVTEVSGYLDASAARFFADSLRQHGTAPRIVGFHDWESVSDYAHEARRILTGVAREARERSQGTHVLTGSAFLRFGLRAANIILGNVSVYTARASYDATLALALRKLAG